MQSGFRHRHRSFSIYSHVYHHQKWFWQSSDLVFCGRPTSERFKNNNFAETMASLSTRTHTHIRITLGNVVVSLINRVGTVCVTCKIYHLVLNGALCEYRRSAHLVLLLLWFVDFRLAKESSTCTLMLCLMYHILQNHLVCTNNKCFKHTKPTTRTPMSSKQLSLFTIHDHEHTPNSSFENFELCSGLQIHTS